MADGLIDIIQPRLPINTGAQVERSDSYRWIKIYDMKDDVGGTWSTSSQNPNAKGGTLEVTGSKLNLKADKKVDKEFAIVYATTVVSRTVR